MNWTQNIMMLGKIKLFGWEEKDGRIYPAFKMKKELSREQAADVAAKIANYLKAEGFLD